MKQSWVLNLLHIQCVKFSSKLSNTPVINPFKKVLGIELYLKNFTKAYVKGDTQNMVYNLHSNTYTYVHRVSQEECKILRESVRYVKLYRYNPKHLYPKLKGYGDNGQGSLKLWQLLLTYWLPNTYWNWQKYVVSVMLISVLNIKVTCEWHKAIKLNYKNSRIHVLRSP